MSLSILNIWMLGNINYHMFWTSQTNKFNKRLPGSETVKSHGTEHLRSSWKSVIVVSRSWWLSYLSWRVRCHVEYLWRKTSCQFFWAVLPVSFWCKIIYIKRSVIVGKRTTSYAAKQSEWDQGIEFLQASFKHKMIIDSIRILCLWEKYLRKRKSSSQLKNQKDEYSRRKKRFCSTH
jgi:hypothetical protein